MRIFFITSKLNFKTSGGSIEEFDLMIRTLIKLGNEVTAITVFSLANDIKKPLPYKVIEENTLSRRLLGIEWSVFKILRKYSSEADFFHIDGHIFLYGAGFYRMLGGKIPVSAFFNRELVCWPDSALTLFIGKENFFIKIKKRVRWLIEKYIGMPVANCIDLFSFVSPMFKTEYENFGLRKDNNSLVISDPIDFSKIMRKNDISEDSYIKKNKKKGTLKQITIFYSSRITRGKGFDLLLDGFSKVKNKKNFHLILGGSGPEEKLVHQMADNLGIKKYITFLGWVTKEDLYQFYKQADIYIQVGWLPYGTSISLLYAMAFGLPSILPSGGGLEWQAKKSAIYVKNGDAEDLARKIEILGNDFKLREELSRNCYKRLAEEELDYKKNIARILEKMRNILKH